MTKIEPGIYAHYKSPEKKYEVLGVGRNTETDEEYVVYKPLYEAEGQPEFWVRPYDMFVDIIEINGLSQPRFKKVG